MSLNEICNPVNTNPLDIYVKSTNIYNPPDTTNFHIVSETGGPAVSRTITISDPLAASFMVLSTDGTVTQGSSITTGVTLSQASGVITTVSSTLAAVTDAKFTVTNTYCTSSSIVLVSLVNYSATLGTNGIPVVSVGSIANGSFDIHITNAHASAALAGVMKIAFLVA